MEYAKEAQQRAYNIKTRAAAKREKEEQKKRETEMQGLNKDQYWKRFVNSEESIVKYYQLYFPDYPDLLVRAIAKRIEGIIQKSRDRIPLTAEDRQYLIQNAGASIDSSDWDYEEEIKQQEYAGKMNVAMRRLDALLTDDQ